MKQSRWIQMGLLFCCTLIMTLTGCGGGGGGGTASTPVLDKTLTYSTSTFTESTANDGSISTSSIIILANETFTGTNGDNWSALVSNLPAGLTASLIRTSPTTATLTLNGKATAHASANNISNLTVIFTNAQFSGGSATQVTGATNRTLSISFNDPTPVQPTPVSVLKGYWVGSQNSTTISAIVLSNGEAWIVQQDAGSINRFSRSQLTPTSTSFSGSGTQYNLITGTSEPLSLSGSYTEKTLLSSTGSATSGSWTMAMNYDKRFETTAKTTDAVGTWRGAYNSNSKTVTITIATDGALTGSSTTGCSYNGVLQPRSADPAVFDLAFTEKCQSNTTALAGIATVNELKTGISFAVTTVDKTQGALFSGTK
jgi:hypothetical protein